VAFFFHFLPTPFISNPYIFQRQIFLELPDCLGNKEAGFLSFAGGELGLEGKFVSINPTLFSSYQAIKVGKKVGPSIFGGGSV